MGNRAIIKAKGNDNKAVYLHWNGGRDSIEAFLKYCEMRGFRDFNDDYGMARFVQVVSNFISSDGLSIGITDSVASHGDNGVYIVDGWEIVGREDLYDTEQRSHDLTELLLYIDECQPTKQQLGEGYILSNPVETSDLEIGNIVYAKDTSGGVGEYTVIGFGEDRFVNGTNVNGIPFVNKFSAGRDYADNINNYILSDNIKLKRNLIF